MADGKVEIETSIDNSGLESGLSQISDALNRNSDEFSKNTKEETKNATATTKATTSENKNTTATDKNTKSQKKNTTEVKKSSKAVNTLKTAFDKTGGSLSSFSNNLASAAESGGAYAAAIVAAIAVLKKFLSGIKEWDEAYRVQIQAETQLATAVKNNPYLNSESVRKLKEYASELQNIGTIGDEELLPMMAQLASAGRTEAEIQDIMSVSLDIAASGTMSLESAVKNLNKTYSGLSGELGASIPQVKSLTTEQLKEGKAVEVLKNQYAGMAEEVAKATGSKKQLENAAGDLKETFGKFFAPSIDLLNNNLTTTINKLNTILQLTDDIDSGRAWINALNKGIKNIQANFKGSEEELNQVISDYLADQLSKEDIYKSVATAKKANEKSPLYKPSKETELIYEALDKVRNKKRSDDAKERDIEEQMAKVQGKTNEELEKRLEILNALVDSNKIMTDEELAESVAIIRTLEARKQKEAELAEQQTKTADDYAKASNKALEEELHALEVEAEAKGESVSAQDKYNVYLNSYIALLTQTAGTIQKGYPVEQKRLEQLKQAKKELDEATNAEEKLAKAIEFTQAVMEALNSGNKNLTPAGELDAGIKSIEEMKAKIKEMSDEEIAAAQKGTETQYSKQELLEGLNETEVQLTKDKVNEVAKVEQSEGEQYKSGQEELLELKKSIDESEVLSEEEKIEALKQLDDQYVKNKKEHYAELASTINDYVNKIADVTNTLTEALTTAAENQKDAELTSIAEQYTDGTISYEEYCDKKLDILRKSAQKEYKIKLWQWRVSLLQAIANTAQGVSECLTQGIPLGIINGALITAAGAAQIASLAASKPTPPSFATGGIVGATTGSDNTIANVRTGEMILNAAQQKQLWNIANGKGGGIAVNMPVTIENNASNEVSAQSQLSAEGLRIVIDKMVNASTRQGRYDDSQIYAENNRTGVRYL